MPRNVRNYWIQLETDGRRSSVETGPKARDGGFSATVLVRENGGISTLAVALTGEAFPDGSLRLSAEARDGNRELCGFRLYSNRDSAADAAHGERGAVAIINGPHGSAYVARDGSAVPPSLVCGPDGEAETLRGALAALLLWATGGNRHGNPYCVPSVRRAFRALGMGANGPEDSTAEALAPIAANGEAFGYPLPEGC